MHKTFGADLRVARRRAGLSQLDCAHLLGIDQPRISKLEAGKAEPTVRELTLGYLVFGEGSEPLWHGLMGSLVGEVRDRLKTLPDCPPGWQARAIREETLRVLAQRLKSGKSDMYD